MDCTSVRAKWTEDEPVIPIKLWEENLARLRGQKRNCKISAAITVVLASYSIERTRAQLHSKCALSTGELLFTLLLYLRFAK